MTRPLCRYQGYVYRAHDPQWAFEPDSGQGAALYGGRFNLIGLPALYTATSVMGAVSEAAQNMAMQRLQPLTIVCYAVDHSSVLDLSTPAACDVAGIEWSVLACNWALLSATGQPVPSWQLADRLRKAGVGAIKVPSFAVGAQDNATNIVFWQWSTALPQQVEVIDDESRLQMKR